MGCGYAQTMAVSVAGFLEGARHLLTTTEALTVRPRRLVSTELMCHSVLQQPLNSTSNVFG